MMHKTGSDMGARRGSPVDDYRKAFKNNFFATPCLLSDLLDLYAGWCALKKMSVQAM